MKITFIDPPNLLEKKNVERVFGCGYSPYPIPNIFSLTNAAVLERAGFEVVFIDAANERWGREKCKKFLVIDSSDMYVFHSVNLSQQPDLYILDLIRGKHRNVYAAFTGPAPTLFASAFLRDEHTFVIRGESEETLRALACALKEGRDYKDIAGLSFFSQGQCVDNPPRALVEDLDSIPFPARHLAKRDIYHNPKLPRNPFTVMQTSRNCPYRCIFCVPNSYSFSRELEYRRYHEDKKPPLRMRSAGNVIAEFRALRAEGYRSVSVIDDQFLWDEPRTVQICEGIKALGIEWGCLARADCLTDTAARHLRQAGLQYIDLGVESFSQKILNDVNKDISVERIYEAVAILKKNRILVKINLLLGASPLQSAASIREDIRKAKELDVDAVMFSVATPFPGTPFYRRAQENRWLLNGHYVPHNVQSRSIIQYPSLSAQEMETMIRRANLSFYFSPRFLFKNCMRMLNPRNAWYGLVALKRKIL